MAEFTYLSALNPIRFYEAGKAPCDGYVQKFGNADDTFIQVIGTNTSSYTLDIVNKYGINAGVSLTPMVRTVNTADTKCRFTTWHIEFSALQECCYKLILTHVEENKRWESDMFNVSKKNNKLTLLQYRNMQNTGDVYYGDADTIGLGFIDVFSLRVEGGFQMKNYIPKSTDTIYMNGDYRYELLHSLSYYTRRYTAGGVRGISDEIFHTIHHALGCDTMFIKGKGHVKFEGASWSFNDIENYQLRTWNIEVAPTGFVLNRSEYPEIPDTPYNDALFHQGYMHPNNYLYNDSFLKSFVDGGGVEYEQVELGNLGVPLGNLGVPLYTTIIKP